MAEFQCLLLGVKQTSFRRRRMSAFDPKRTLAVRTCRDAQRGPPHGMVRIGWVGDEGKAGGPPPTALLSVARQKMSRRFPRRVCGRKSGVPSSAAVRHYHLAGLSGWLGTVGVEPV